MVGTGYNEWVATSEKLPAVPHAMRMPETELTANQRLVRAWFGKMMLLPSYQRMLKQMDFAEHRNLTAQYVQQGQQTNIPRLGCAPSRRLVASADSCTYRSCVPKPAVPKPADGCSVVCNRQRHRGDLEECAAACTCESSDSHASPEISPATPPPAPTSPSPASALSPPAPVSPPPTPATPPPPSTPVVPPPASVIPAPVPIAPMSPPSTSGQPPSSHSAPTPPSSSPTITSPPKVDNQRPSDACKDSDTSIEHQRPLIPQLLPCLPCIVCARVTLAHFADV
ncbi:uncharacterized protein PHALS_01576 [Plasmopara halstedii]|uniref:Uncharacterized protein n=1 Tax=Plasmopara halstedii TaxID=4781 RepID=A0A0N7L6U7_PLAHL|nr:uncharacterized protein PHALS_01576 [Plasmopara halstedii]CEG45267.1 hypothetical protein PHALS_01576 [Plasmopara halstedii]|eukprot:XP_024581636.1 hypothetical protein PHALS_01576 [Plasmopara halstedii]